MTTYLNGAQVLSQSPPKAKLNVSTAIHLGGGGDLSQPDPILMREALITNPVMTSSGVTAMKANQTSAPHVKYSMASPARSVADVGPPRAPRWNDC
jgi:hypothetical protein